MFLENHSNILNFKNLKLKILFFLCFFLVLSPSNGFAKLNSEIVKSKATKVVMMLDIVAKEYALGIQNRKIINAMEFEESQIFLNQAQERYGSIIGAMPNSETAKELKTRLQVLSGNIKEKVDPGEVKITINALQTQLLKELGIEILKSPPRPIDMNNGRKIFKTSCALCHGMTGNGDGPLAMHLDPKPAILTDPGITGNEESTAYDNFQVLNVGIANTAMVAWSEFLSEEDLWDVTYFIRTFSNKNVPLPVIVRSVSANKDSSTSPKFAIAQVIATLDETLKNFKEGNTQDAADLAFDAYLGYEKLERNLATKRKELSLSLESAFGHLRAEIKRDAKFSHVQNIKDRIQVDLKEAQIVLEEKISFTGLFLQSLSIIVREGFEAILIVAALIAFLIKSRNKDKVKIIYKGVFIGIVASFITAYILHEILNISMAKQELIEGWIMLVAVVVLFWVSYWLVTKIEAAKWQSYITSKMTQAVSTGNAFTLGMVAFLSVYREGFETVLFYKALYLYAGNVTTGIIPGFLAGCLLLAGLFYIINKLGLKIPIKWFFGFTSVLLYFMAFTFMGKGLHELQMGEALSITVANFAPEISWLGMYPTWETFIGQMLLVLAFVGAVIYSFLLQPEVESKSLKAETTNIKKDILIVHDLAEHITEHAQKCKEFLKDTKGQDLQELSEHLIEIDSKVHGLADHVQFLEDKLIDQYERLGFDIEHPGKD
jgi:high-affinity iron transporter